MHGSTFSWFYLTSRILMRPSLFRYSKIPLHGHGPDTDRTRPDKVRAHCRRRAKFHYTDTDTDPTRTRHGPDRTRTDPHGPARTRTDFFAAKLRWVRAGPVGPVQWNLARTRQRARTLSVSGPCRVRVRVRVVEFSSYPTTCADFVRVWSVSGPCSGI